MDLEIVILTEASHTEKNKYHIISLYVESKKKWYKWTYLQNRNRFTDVEYTYGYQERSGGGINWKSVIAIYTLL